MFLLINVRKKMFSVVKYRLLEKVDICSLNLIKINCLYCGFWFLNSTRNCQINNSLVTRITKIFTSPPTGMGVVEKFSSRERHPCKILYWWWGDHDVGPGIIFGIKWYGKIRFNKVWVWMNSTKSRERQLLLVILWTSYNQSIV